MVDENISEATALMSGIPKPRYTFDSSIVRQRKRRLRQFQCCVCTMFLAIIMVAMAISVGLSINTVPSDANSTDTDLNDTFVVLFQYTPFDNEKIITKSEYQNAMAAGKKALNERDVLEKSTPQLPRNSPSYKHQKIVATSNKGRMLSRLGFVEEYAVRYLNMSKSNVSKACFAGQPDVLFSVTCANQTNRCNLYQKFRTFNGTCNNLRHPEEYGVAYRPFKRILPPDYADGISAPRVSSDGKPLPSARTISQVVHRPIYQDDPKFTVMLAIFGQFLDHDITATASSQGQNGTSISCCGKNLYVHPECFPVALDENDFYYQNYNVSCMEFVRSAPAVTCCLGPREQLNQATSYIDASVIYGSDNDVVKRLRRFRNGELKMMVVEGNRTLLPASDDPDDGCNLEEEIMKGRYCFMTGDARANENLHLTSLHLIWARHHNNIAANLLNLNPHWNDERIFQEARRIIGAQLQHVTYNEFLPILLGEYSVKFGLKPLKQGYYHGYNESVDASVANGFAAATFRFAHTLIPTLIKMVSSDNSSGEVVELRRILLDPFKLYKEGVMDSAIRGAITQNIQANDPYFTPELKEHMFEHSTTMNSINSSKLCGLDLVSLNIQRGRDHGLAGYTSWREKCGLRRPRTFNQLTGDIDDDSLNYIQSVYRNIDDIDFYTGALSEKPLENGFLGPTLTCLILDQFLRLKQGDRFFYENPNIFNLEQLGEIRKTTLAAIICDNSDGIELVQPMVMMRPQGENVPLPCSNITYPQWSRWKENLHSVAVPAEGLLAGRNE